MDDVATEVSLAIEDHDDRVASELRTARFRRYLRTARQGPVAVGDEWSEVVNDGCGATTPVILRVRAVDGGTHVGEGTTFDIDA